MCDLARDMNRAMRVVERTDFLDDLGDRVIRKINGVDEMPKFGCANNQQAADKECRKQCRLAKQSGSTVPYSLSRMIEAKVPLSTIRAVSR